MSHAPDSTPPLQEVDVYVEETADEQRITYIRKLPRSGEEEPKPERQIRSFFLYLGYLAFCWLFLFIPSSAATAALPIVTVTIVPKTQTITTTHSVELPARLLAPLTLSQAQTVKTTGHGHQNATKAKGYITFYNGLFQSQTIAAGTIITASNGVHIITDLSAYIPAANPPGLGVVTIHAHAVTTGVQGNIPAYAINTLCCATAVKAVNRYSFTGGQDERFFRTVSQNDIDGIAKPLSKTLHASMQAAFTAQLTPAEVLIPPLCSETVSPDHQPGAEATTVTVTVSQTCTAGAYKKQLLQEQTRQLLTTAAYKQLGEAYSQSGDTKLTITHAAIHNGKAILAVTCSGIWVYHFSQAQEQELVSLIAGKPKAQAIQTLLANPGIQAVTISGISESASVPGEEGYIHLIVS